MIPKIKTGSSFSGVLNYTLKNEKDAIIIDKNMLGDTPEQLNNEFKMLAEQNTRAQKKVKHIILSFAPEDREVLTRDKMIDISQEFIAEMGYTDNQYITALHTDTKHQHLHIILNRVKNSDKKVVNDSHEKRKGSRIARSLERKYNLRITPSEKIEGVKHESKEERELKQRLATSNTDEVTHKEKIKEVVKNAVKDSKKIDDVILKLKNSGVKLHFTGNKKGDIIGWKFEYKNREYKASTIDRGLSWGNTNKTLKENRQSRNKGMRL